MRPGAEADDSYGVIEFGSCGFTHSDGVLAYPKDMYAALAGATPWQPVMKGSNSRGRGRGGCRHCTLQDNINGTTSATE